MPKKSSPPATPKPAATEAAVSTSTPASAVTPVTLRMSREIASAVVESLDLASRIGIGQFEEIANIAQWELCDRNGKPPSHAAIDAARRELGNIKRLLIGMEPNASHGILSDKVNVQFKRAWDVKKALEHRLSWDRTPEGSIGVNFDEPIHGMVNDGIEVHSFPATENAALDELPAGTYIGRRGANWTVNAPSADGKHMDLLGESSQVQTAISQAKNKLSGAPKRKVSF